LITARSCSRHSPVTFLDTFVERRNAGFLLLSNRFAAGEVVVIERRRDTVLLD
jgi:hypothetical protein